MSADFTSLSEMTAADLEPFKAYWPTFVADLPARVLGHLEMMTHAQGGLPVTQFEHALQTATRAHRAGRDEEYVVCALLHDLGDMLAPTNHAELAAAVLGPYVSEANRWMLEKHAIFQGYYYFHHLGLDRHARAEFSGHPHFERTAEFCHLFDQASFDPNYDTMPLDAFRPMVGRILASERVGQML